MPRNRSKSPYKPRSLGTRSVCVVVCVVSRLSRLRCVVWCVPTSRSGTADSLGASGSATPHGGEPQASGRMAVVLDTGQGSHRESHHRDEGAEAVADAASVHLRAARCSGKVVTGEDYLSKASTCAYFIV
jgi:hypothetical protein